MDKELKKKFLKKEKKNLNININNNNNNLFPHKTNLNNLKSKKYFSSTTKSSELMKNALIKYRENKNKINNTQNTLITNSSMSTCLTRTKQSIFKFDKNLLNNAEPRTKTSFQKISPKMLEDSSKDQINNNDETEELKIYNYKRKIIKNKIKTDENENHKKFISAIKQPINININIDSIIDDDDLIDFDINMEDEEFNIYGNNLTDRYKNNLNIGINLHDINYSECIKIENLFSELIKDLEFNKMNKFENKLNIVYKFLNIFNDKINHNLFLTFDMNSLNNLYNKNNNLKKSNENIFLIIKEYLIQQLIFFYIIILIGLIKNENEKNIYLSGLQNLSFYFHQNFQVFNFILTSKINKNNIDLLSAEAVESYEKCMNMVRENKTWLNENNFMKCLQINNKMSKQVIKNLFEQIRIYFNTNPYFEKNTIYRNKNNIKSVDNKKKIINKKNFKINNYFNSCKSLSKNKNKTIGISSSNKNNLLNNKNNLTNNNKDFIESDINLFLEYIKSYKNVKFTSLLKDLKCSPSINYLIDKVQELDNNNNNKIKTTIKKNNSKAYSDSPDKEKPVAPFLKPINPKYKYTLVLDLDETLIHHIPLVNSDYIQIRPGAEEFVNELAEFYEIVIFTASCQIYADLVINGFDTENKVSARLYRQHTTKIGNANIKDLAKLGRDLKKVIIIDNYPDNYNLQPKNGINVIDFEGNRNDDILFYLKKDLIKLVKMGPDDVRNHLKEIQVNMNKRGNEIINSSRNIDDTHKNVQNIRNDSKKKIITKKNIINDKIIEAINENEFENTIIPEKDHNKNN